LAHYPRAAREGDIRGEVTQVDVCMTIAFAG
jgi:hypothetical protein